MKKIVLLILGVLLFIPIMVFADMGAPGIETYSASIINKDGAIIYDRDYDEEAEKVVYIDTNKKVEYGKTVEIIEEEDGYALIEGGYLKLTDLEPIKKSYTLIEKDWASKVEGIILKKVEMRTGPANGYAKVGVTLEPGTKVSVRRYKDSDTMYSWVYVEYNGQKGYIDSYQGTVTLGTGKAYFMTYADTDFLNPTTNEKMGVIKANTVIEGTYYKLDAWSRGYYFEKGDIKGIIKYDDLAQRHDINEGKLIQDVKLYKSLDLENIENSEVVTTLKAGTAIRNNISYDKYGEYVYYQNGNVSGWIVDGAYDEKTETNIDVIKYTKTDIKDSYVVKETNTLDVELIKTTTPEPVNPSNPEPANPDESKPYVVVENKMPKYLYYYVSGAIILFLLAIVIILLVNRKKGTTN